MTNERIPLQPGAEQQITVPFRPRGAYAGYRAFGDGDGAVLVEPGVVRELRSAAELATAEGRIAGGLLFGRGWADDLGAYLVVNGFLEAGPGENSGDRLTPDGADEFTLSEADLRLLRRDATRMYSASLELGWWRTLPALGEFGPGDFATQAQLVGPDGVGLLVYGSGIHWGTAYLGPDGHAPDAAGTLVTAAPGTAAEPPVPDPDPDPVPELVDLGAGESLLAEEPLPTPPGPGPTRRRGPTRRGGPTVGRGPARVRVPPQVRSWAARKVSEGSPRPETPADVQFVVGGLIIAIVAVAIIVGVLVHSLLVAIIIAVIGLLAVFITTGVSRR